MNGLPTIDNFVTQRAVLIEPHYLPCIEYITLLRPYTRVVLDIGRVFKKSSYMNRAYIATANKVMLLSVPVTKGRHNHEPISASQIFYAENWVKQHATALRSAYGGSPFYIYYKDELDDILNKHCVLLSDLLIDTTCFLLRQLLPHVEIMLWDGKTDNTIYDDKRETLLPHNRMLLQHSPYYQVFMHKYGFQPNLSAIDLLYNTGPDAQGYIAGLNL